MGLPRPRVALLVALLAMGGMARAAGDPVADRAAEVGVLETERMGVEQRRHALELAGGGEAAEIERLKSQPAGIARDLRLQQLLASSQQRADQLSRAAADLRARDARLHQARVALIEACRTALADPSITPARRGEITRVESGAQRGLALPAEGAMRVAPASAIDPLAGPEELGEHADRLRDDEDKLAREATRLARRIDSIEQRLRLRERAAEMDEDLFMEWGVGRRATRVALPQTSGGSSNAATAAVPATGGRDGASFSNSPTTTAQVGGGAADSSTPTMLRGVVDPSTLEELQRAEAGQDPEVELRALRRARGDLQSRQGELSRREAELRRRAAELRRSK